MGGGLMIRTLAGLALVASLAACASEQPLPKPDANGTYLFWKPEEQLAGYRKIEKIFPTHVIKRGDHVAPLPKAPKELEVAYPFRGGIMTTESFMAKANTVGVLVIHHGQIVLERYAQGYGPGQRWTSFSVAKSLTSTLTGIALKEGKIRSLEDPVTNYLPGLKGSAYEGVTVRNLLNMTSGVKWNERYDDPKSDEVMIHAERSINGSDPIVTYMARLPREAPPGTKIVYKTGETHLLGSLIRAATGKSLADYLSEKIWKPYGMEKDGVWMLDAAGHEYAGCCISATLRDFGRFGLFFMNGAKIGGVPVVGDTWIKDATTGSSPAEGYGFQWWLFPLTDGPSFEAQGIFGQLIDINPKKDLVVVIQSAWPLANRDPANTPAFVSAIAEAVH